MRYRKNYSNFKNVHSIVKIKPKKKLYLKLSIIIFEEPNAKELSTFQNTHRQKKCLVKKSNLGIKYIFLRM